MASAKGDRIATLIEVARSSGEVDRSVATMARDVRREELLGMDKMALKELCEQAGVDIMVKDIVAERIISHESEQGRIIIATEVGKPPAKKARSSKK